MPNFLAKQKKKSTSQNKHCCISISIEKGLASISYITQDANQNHIVICNSIPFKDPHDFKNNLSKYIAQHDLANTPCGIIIHPPHYQLLKVKKPNVPENEYSQAIHWLVSDQIEGPTDKFALTAFSAPNTSSEDEQIYVVKSELAYLQGVLEALDHAKLICQFIDIRELAFVNILNALNDTEDACILLELEKDSSHIMIFNKKLLYLTRYFNYNLLESSYNALLDEIRESAEYFNLQLGQPMPTIMYINNHQEIPLANETIANDLSIFVKQIDGHDLFPDFIMDTSVNNNTNHWYSLAGLLRLIQTIKGQDSDSTN